MKTNFKKTVVSLVTIIAIAGGSAFTYNQIYADTNADQTNEPITESIVAPTNELAAEVIPDVTYSSSGEILLPVIQDLDIQKIDLEQTDVRIPLDLAQKSVEKTSLNNVNPISSLTEVRALQNGSVNEVIAFYKLADEKHEVIVFQTENTYGGIQGAVDATKAVYDPKDVRVEETNGQTFVIEDSETRKHVHLITDSYYFTVSSPGTLNLNLLLEIAEKIKA